MKKKGFTLIELLAVILILGIIALIAIPTVTKIIETAKKNSLKVSANGVLEAGNYYYATNGKDIEDEIVFTCSGNKCINGDKVVNYSGNVENGILVIKKNGDMGICINNGKYYASKDIENDNVEPGKGICNSYNDGMFIVSSTDDRNKKYKEIIESLIDSNSIIWDYDYTGSEQILEIPVDGIYKLEVWGAQGGSSIGYGGYSVGTIELEKKEKLYINVGGKGIKKDGNGSYCTPNADLITGGYNGGGNGYAGSQQAVSGGGATHIALESGLLSTFSSKIEKILIVAGGGGYESAGGYKGVDGTSSAPSVHWFQGLGGTQTAGGVNYNCSNVSGCSATVGGGYSGTFGQGGQGNNTDGCSGSGGGGGYYGGGGSGRGHDTSGGGSGYIGNTLLDNKVMYCYDCSSNNEELTKTISTTNVSNSAISNYAKSGDGYAKITLINVSNDEKIYKELYNYLIENNIIKWNFDYTGDEQVFNVPIKGKYKLELWGAQGGYALENGSISGIGGSGGYSSGMISLNKNDKLYINVGGKGENGIEGSNSLGGYNGGGIGLWDTTDNEATGGGGGATHIALSSGLLSIFEDKKNDILIVAGGGGGAAWSYIGGHGGGFQGNKNENRTNSSIIAGSQDSGYNFGQGGVGTICQTTPGGGGGSGYYGGTGGIIVGSCDDDKVDAMPGAGGSGYIGNALLTNKIMYCYSCTVSNNESTKTISTNNVSSSAISNYAKIGNGYARITLISLN